MPAELAELIGHADGGALLLRTYRHVSHGETRAASTRLGTGSARRRSTTRGKRRAGVRQVARTHLSRSVSPSHVNGTWTSHPVLHAGSPAVMQGSGDGRYWARTSDPQLVELVLSQLS